MAGTGKSLAGSSRIKWLASRVRGKRILDLGCCGTDFSLNRAIREANPDSTMVGLDYNRGRLVDYASGQGENLAAGDAYRLPFKAGSFDAVVAAELVEHDVRPLALFSEIARVLAPSGRLYLSTPNPWDIIRMLRNWLFCAAPFRKANVRSYLGSEDHQTLYDPLSLANLLARCSLEVAELTTRGYPLFVRRDWLNWPFNYWPLDRFNCNACLMAVKK